MLTLTVTSYRRMPPGQPATRRFDRSGGTIGRAPDCDWALPDPEQHLSKHHCRIGYQDGRYTVMDTSTNGVFLDGAAQPLGQGNTTVLKDGDQLVIGDFEIEVRLADEADAVEAPRAYPGPDDPFGLGRWDEPIARSPAAAPPGQPGDFGAQPGGDDFWNQVGRVEDEWPTTTPDHVPPEQEGRLVAPPSPPRIPEDWDQPLPTERSQPPSAPPPPPTVPPSLNHDVPLQAFLDGAGVPQLDLSNQDPTELMRRAGEITRTVVEGLREVLAARAMVKGEFRISQTVIAAKGNNPLKFSVGPDEALRTLLGPERPGYMPAVAAVREALGDLKAHEIATVAALQAALARLFREFDPEQLKQRLEHHSILDDILPGSRKAKYWELYEAFYRQIAREMAEDLQGVFGREFARAYEEQVRKL